MKQRLAILAVAIMTALTGCVKVTVEDPSGERHFTISLVNNSEAQTRTPGEDQYNENQIDKIDIFFSDPAGNILYHPTLSQTTYMADKVRLTIPEQDAQLLFNRDLILYMVANSNVPRSEFSGKSLSAIRLLIHENAETFNPSPFAPQQSFLMDGTANVSNLNKAQTDMGKVIMKRVAAKVMVNITDASVDGYTATEVALRLSNYLDKGRISGAEYIPAGDEYKSSGYRILPAPSSGNSYSAEPFYSYPSAWNDNPAKESFITVRIKWRHNDTGIEKYYYYRIPFSYVSPQEGNTANYRLQRNYIYTFSVNINALGGLDPEEMVDLDMSFQLKDWSTRDIVAELNHYDYLLVAEKYVEMHDITHREIRYISSKPVTVKVDSAYYHQYLSSGTINRIDLTTANGGFYPKATVDTDAGNIVVDCNVPINYVPTYMQLTVSNGAMKQVVRVVQYPRQFLTSRYSNRNDIDFAYYTSIGESAFWYNSANGTSVMTNFNLYTITTMSLSPSDDFVIGGDMTAIQEFFPYKNILGTKTDAETNRMISPKFVVASQRGIQSLLDYNRSALRCSIYSEGGYPPGTWRMPTVAEMSLIMKLQSDYYSALTNLFVPANSDQGRWWTAKQDSDGTCYIYNLVGGKLETTEASKQFAVRCVHDVWQDQ